LRVDLLQAGDAGSGGLRDGWLRRWGGRLVFPAGITGSFSHFFFSELGGMFGGLDCEEFGSVALVGCEREEAVECTT